MKASKVSEAQIAFVLRQAEDGWRVFRMRRFIFGARSMQV